MMCMCYVYKTYFQLKWWHIKERENLTGKLEIRSYARKMFAPPSTRWCCFFPSILHHLSWNSSFFFLSISKFLFFWFFHFNDQISSSLSFFSSKSMPPSAAFRLMPLWMRLHTRWYMKYNIFFWMHKPLRMLF